MIAELDALLRVRGGAAQLHVLRDGVPVVDRSFGCAPDDLFWTFSASKPYVAVLVHQLAERGVLDLDDPVAAHWPEFAGRGKAAVTVRQVLRHRSGLATAGSTLGDIRAMTDWARSVHRLEHAPLRWTPGTVPAYQFLGFGFILGELARRVTGTPVRQLMSELVLDPLGVRDTHLGLRDELWPRHVPLRAAGPAGALVNAVVNRPRTRAAIIPSAGISTTARDLASFYDALLRGDLLSPTTLAPLLEPTSDGVIDSYARQPIRWSEGFQLGGPGHVPGAISPMGRRSNPRAFGHNGSNSCLAWADPDRRLAFAYLTNRITRRRADIAHHAAVADLVLTAFGN